MIMPFFIVFYFHITNTDNISLIVRLEDLAAELTFHNNSYKKLVWVYKAVL